MTARFIVGDTRDVLATLPAGSVDLVFTSPPFLALRSYLPADHPDKGREIGSEPTPADFLDTLLDVVELCDRVLAPHGSLVFELGDTYCADTETEVLTRSGWRAWDALAVGDQVLTISPQSQLAEWNEVEAVNVFSAERRRMLSLEGRSMSALVTANHRWLVNQRGGASGRRSWQWEFRTSDTLTLDSSVPTAAPVADLPAEPKWSDALVEAVAWYWTEGHDRKPGAGRYQPTGIYIAQSRRVNPANVARIRACLTALFGAPLERLPGVKNAAPAWRECEWPSQGDKTEFRLNAAAARVLREHAPGKVPRVEWLAELTQAQLDLFIERSIDADGQRTARGVGLAQNDYDRASAFQAACILAGRSASLNVRQSHCPMWAVTVNTGVQRKPLRQASAEWIEHDGIVWCPTTRNGTWLARRRGTVYFTGNSGSGGAGGDYAEGGMRDGQPKFVASRRHMTTSGDRYADHPLHSVAGGRGWPLPKSLCGIPTLFAWSLAYGRNLLRPERTTEPWRIRNVVAWCRPNPPVGALGDKFRPGTSYLTVACKSDKRYFDLDAVRTPFTGHGFTEGSERSSPDEGATQRNWSQGLEERRNTHAGAPPLDWWEIPTQPFKGAHYATFPEKLVERPVKAMCPERVCTTCGEPSRRIVGEATYDRTDSDVVPARLAMTDGARVAEGVNQHVQSNGANTSVIRNAPTLGWTDCGHDSWRRGVVLDVFAGSGTTLAVAEGHGRDSIGIDLDARNAELARERVGMWLTVEEHVKEGAA